MTCSCSPIDPWEKLHSMKAEILPFLVFFFSILAFSAILTSPIYVGPWLYEKYQASKEFTSKTAAEDKEGEEGKLMTKSEWRKIDEDELKNAYYWDMEHRSTLKYDGEHCSFHALLKGNKDPVWEAVVEFHRAICWAEKKRYDAVVDAGWEAADTMREIELGIVRE